MTTYRLAPAASQDLEKVLYHGLEQFGTDQARLYRDGIVDTFAFLAQFPRAARLRHEVDPPVRVHRFRAHVILYDVVDDASIVIQRIRHGREDWQAEPSSH